MATKIYSSGDVCYAEDPKGDIIRFGKGEIFYKPYDSDANVLIWGLKEYTKTNPLYSGAVTSLTDSGGTPYANLAALEVVLADFFDAGVGTGTYISSNGLTGDGTTYIDTDDSTYANQIIGKSPQTGTGYMVQIFNGETVSEPTFQIQANGSILNQGLATIMYKSGVDSVFVGTYKPHSNATGSNNFAAGYFAGSSITTGQSGVMIGANAGILTTTANYNVFVGADSGRTNVSGNANVYVGYSAGYLNKGDRCIFIGNQAGKGQSNVDNRLLISGYAFSDAATELTNSIIRGEMGATPSVQELYFNAQKINMNYLPTSAAGLASGDIWNNSGVLNIV